MSRGKPHFKPEDVAAKIIAFFLGPGRGLLGQPVDTALLIEVATGVPLDDQSDRLRRQFHYGFHAKRGWGRKVKVSLHVTRRRHKDPRANQARSYRYIVTEKQVPPAPPKGGR